MVINNLDEKINSFIKRKQINQDILAENLGISKRNLNYIIETKEIKKFETFVKLCYVLSVSPNELLEEINDVKLAGNIIVPFPELSPTRALVEIEYENLSDLTKKRYFSVLLKKAGKYINIEFKNPEGVKEYYDCKLPHLFNNSAKYFNIEQFIHKNRLKALLKFKSSPMILVGSKINTPELIKEETLYVTVNSKEGKDFTYLKYNQYDQEITFIGDAYTDADQDVESLVNLYTLKSKDVYEIWEVKCLITILDIFEEDYFTHLLHSKESLIEYEKEIGKLL